MPVIFSIPKDTVVQYSFMFAAVVFNAISIFYTAIFLYFWCKYSLLFFAIFLQISSGWTFHAHFMVVCIFAIRLSSFIQEMQDGFFDMGKQSNICIAQKI